MTHVVQKKIYRAYGDLLHMVSACFLRACRQGHLEIAMFFYFKTGKQQKQKHGFACKAKMQRSSTQKNAYPKRLESGKRCAAQPNRL